jgi:hypothetical protein
MSSAIMSIKQLNEYLVGRATALSEKSRKKRAEYDKDLPLHTTDIVPPGCYPDWSLKQNIDNLMACYNNTLMAGLFYETEVVKLQVKLGALKAIIDNEKSLIFDFLEEIGLVANFYEFVNLKRFGIPAMSD